MMEVRFGNRIRRSIAICLALLCYRATAQDSEWKLDCGPTEYVLHMYHSINVTCHIIGPEKIYSEYKLVVHSNNQELVKADNEIWLKSDKDGLFPESFNITGLFLGKTNVSVQVQQRSNPPETTEVIDVIVIRQKRVIDVVFHASVAILVSIIYINFGCALNWHDLKSNLKRPYGPLIGIVGQFLLMPIISFVVGKIMFPDNAAMQLGMFFTGVSPGGGASNMWTVILGGNLDLSITMTTISTFAAFAMMPFWLFTLGRIIFQQAKLDVPYTLISTYALTLVIPLFIGFLIQRYLKKVSIFLVKILKGFSSILMIFIIVFAIVTNLYLFKLFSWRIIVASLGLPWLGYILAWCLATVCKQNWKDSLTIAIETGIQNTGISIFLLRFALQQPEADLTTVVPVAVASMTPIPLLCLYVFQVVRARCSKHSKLENSELNSPMSELDGDDNNSYIIKGPKSISTIS